MVHYSLSRDCSLVLCKETILAPVYFSCNVCTKSVLISFRCSEESVVLLVEVETQFVELLFPLCSHFLDSLDLFGIYKKWALIFVQRLELYLFAVGGAYVGAF